jgi:hypothetical protein
LSFDGRGSRQEAGLVEVINFTSPRKWRTYSQNLKSKI